MASLHTFEMEPSPARPLSRPRLEPPSRLARLVRRARQGERDAFDRLVEMHREGLRSFLMHRVEPAELEDVIQDVFVAAWRAIPKYDGRSQFRTWLFAIAFNKVRDLYRLRLRRVAEVPAAKEDPPAASQADPFAAKDLSLAVRQLLTSLSPAQSEVILLYYQDELTLAEIAGLLNRNLSTVKYQFFQAHSRLADLIRKSPDWSAWIVPRPREESR